MSELPASNQDFITPKTDEEALVFLRDHVRFAANFVEITNKKGVKVPLLWNRPQKLYVKRKGDATRVYVLKARKFGISTWCISEDTHACGFATRPQHNVLLTHSDKSADVMYHERVKPIVTSWSSKTPWIDVKFHDARKRVMFKNDVGTSTYYVATAGSKKFGRGDDITRLHTSELCHWQSREVLTAVEQACVDDAHITIETTANGENFGKLIWDDARDGSNKYRPIFLPWYCGEDYTIPGGGATIGALGEDEKKLVEAFGLTLDQLAWRRDAIRGMSDPTLFPQEYPATEMEAFLGSGRMVFDWQSLMQHEQRSTEAPYIGECVDDGHRSVFKVNPMGGLKIWQHPLPGHIYVIGGDVAEGLKDGAYSTWVVLDLLSDDFVAEWHGHIPPDVNAEIGINIAKYYNDAMLVPESWPGPGGVTCAQIIERGYRKVWQNPQNDRLGWETNHRTKKMMMHLFAGAVRDFRVNIHSKALVKEMRSYRYVNPHGTESMEPARGSFSDRIIGAAIAWYVSRQQADQLRGNFQRLTGSGRRGYNTSVPKFQGPRIGVRPKD